MSTLHTLKKLVLGETWLLPLGVAVVVGGSDLIVRPLVGAEWHHLGGLIILAGIVALLLVSVAPQRRGADACPRSRVTPVIAHRVRR